MVTILDNCSYNIITHNKNFTYPFFFKFLSQFINQLSMVIGQLVLIKIHRDHIKDRR